jgi:KUP system potassium uptake protein
LSTATKTSKRNPAALAALSLVALGVVFGDIGTSPLYALRETFHGAHLAVTRANVLGVLSLLFWTMTVVVSFKYVLLILRADNNGEGGLIAMMALATQAVKDKPVLRRRLMLLGLFGTAIFFGDAVITPAMTVLGAVEGIDVYAPEYHGLIVPVTLLILTGLFAFQRLGTGTVGKAFGPIMLVWFVALAALGVPQIIANPEVLQALNPAHALQFGLQHRWMAFVALGAAVLVVTGGEALYADLGHFGKGPIRLSWYGLVMPALTLNYFGQGALLLSDPTAIKNPFYLLAPAWAEEVVRRGAGEILLTSMDRDGVRSGYDLGLLRAVTNAVKVPVIASGGAGEARHMVEAVTEGGADAVLAASIFHFGDVSIREVKAAMAAAGLPVRQTEPAG